MTDLSDATSRLLTWIEAERKEGYPSDLGAEERAALAEDIQKLIDHVDLSPDGRVPLEYDPIQERQYVYVVWSLSASFAQIVAICTRDHEIAKFREAAEAGGAHCYSERVPLDVLLDRHDFATIIYQRIASSE